MTCNSQLSYNLTHLRRVLIVVTSAGVKGSRAVAYPPLELNPMYALNGNLNFCLFLGLVDNTVQHSLVIIDLLVIVIYS